MALKFLNKKGWHTGSLRNVENVWKAEQKHEAEQRKLEELRKQIQEERERSEFRALQEQAGLVPRQERLEFLYDSGLAVGRGASGPDGGGVAFKALQEDVPDPGSKSADKQSLVPGALFEEKPHSANDAWRKLHSDPLLLIRQREQEALARLKNNPVQMALIRKSVEEKKHKEKDRDNKERKKKHHHSSKKHHHSHSKQHRYSSSKNYSDAEDDGTERKSRKSSIHKKSSYGKHYERREPDSENESSETGSHRKNLHKGKYRDRSPIERTEPKTAESYGPSASKRVHDKSKREEYSYKGRMNHDSDEKSRENVSSYDVSVTTLNRESQYRRRNSAPKLSEEERAARLREMQQDAVLHEEQRWKRLRKAEENDAREAKQANISSGRNFLDAAHKSVYGAEKGGSSTIEESVRRRTHYLQGRSEAEGNAFRR